MDAASGHIKVKFQTHFLTQKTVKAIKRCKQKARDNAIMVQECQLDNESLFTSKSLREHLLEEGQTSEFLGAGSQHQNSRAGRGTQTMMWMETDLLVNVKHHHQHPEPSLVEVSHNKMQRNVRS